MIETYQELEVKEVKLGETVKAHMALRSHEGRLWVDLRKWYQYPNVEGFRASKKGIMLDLEGWRQAIPLIQELINSQSK